MKTLSDSELLKAFENDGLALDDFNHAVHVRLAYLFLQREADMDSACDCMRKGTRAFLQQHGVPAEKYSETITRAWMLAVRHFMTRLETAVSSLMFLQRFPQLTEGGIMLTHYSPERLFSDAGRQVFLEPDLDPIPRHVA